MQKSAFNQRVVIGRNIVNRRVLLLAMIGTADAHNRHVDIGEQGFDGWVVVIGNDAVTQPLFNVFDTRAEIFLYEDIPLGL